MSRKTAIITGIFGQDGGLLADYLLNLGYRVIGLQDHRRATKCQTLRDLKIQHRVHFKYTDFQLPSALKGILDQYQPDEFYHLAGQSSVALCQQEQAECYSSIVGLSACLLDPAIWVGRTTRLFIASTSELFRASPGTSNEMSDFEPISQYARYKLTVYNMVVRLRSEFGVHASAGLLFPHESRYRRQNFVIPKIVSTLVRIERGEDIQLQLGNLDVVRDFGYAGDYVKAMHACLQISEPGDFVIATGIGTSIRWWAEEVCRLLALDLEWHGTGLEEHGLVPPTDRKIISVNPALVRENENHRVVGNPAKLRQLTGWKPETSVTQLADMMVAHYRRANSQETA